MSFLGFDTWNFGLDSWWRFRWFFWKFFLSSSRFLCSFCDRAWVLWIRTRIAKGIGSMMKVLENFWESWWFLTLIWFDFDTDFGVILILMIELIWFYDFAWFDLVLMMILCDDLVLKKTVRVWRFLNVLESFFWKFVDFDPFDQGERKWNVFVELALILWE